jgi:hypothetical protein
MGPPTSQIRHTSTYQTSIILLPMTCPLHSSFACLTAPISRSYVFTTNLISTSPLSVFQFWFRQTLLPFLVSRIGTAAPMLQACGSEWYRMCGRWVRSGLHCRCDPDASTFGFMQFFDVFQICLAIRLGLSPVCKSSTLHV